METMNQTKYPFEVRLPMRKGSLILDQCEDPLKLLAAYRARLGEYSANVFNVTPYPVKLSEIEKGRIEPRQMKDVVEGVEMGIPTEEILEDIAAKYLSERMIRHHTN